MGHIRMTRAGIALLFAAALFVTTWAFEGPAAPAHALTNCTADTSLDSEESAFLGLINNYRAQNGLGALSVSTNLTRASTWLAADMGAKSYFNHTDSLGRSPSQRAVDCGYPSGAGENIAAGTVWDTAQEAFDAWRNSAGHNANMLTGSYRQIGIARVYTAGSPYGWYWVTDFGNVSDGTSGGGSGGGTGGGGTTPTPTPSPVTAAKASLTSPTPGSTLSGSSATFAWDTGTSAQEYFLYVGSSAGANNYYASSTGLSRSATVSNLPTNGSTLYVRLWTRLPAGWQYSDYTYRAATVSSGGGGGGGTTTLAKLVSPAPGSTVHGSSATFSWTAASGGLAYYLYVGTYVGGFNVAGIGTGLATSTTVSGLPANGGTLYVRLWTYTSTGWQYADYTLTSAP